MIERRACAAVGEHAGADRSDFVGVPIHVTEHVFADFADRIGADRAQRAGFRAFVSAIKRMSQAANANSG